MNPPNQSSWPNNADGNVFRSLAAQGFDFSKTYTIDFNIDFDVWPPGKQALEVIRKVFPDAEEVYDEEDGLSGYVIFTLTDKVTYDFVMKIQKTATELVTKYGGRCESWGILH